MNENGKDEAGQEEGENAVTEEFRVSGETLTAKIRALLREGNVRRIVLKNEEGKTLVEIPLTIGVVGALLLPVWVGVGVVAALAANLNFSLRRADGVKLAQAEASAASADPNNTSEPLNNTPPGAQRVD